MIRDFEIKDIAPIKIIDDTEEELKRAEEDLEKAITGQLRAHGYTDEEIKKWFEEADKQEV